MGKKRVEAENPRKRSSKLRSELEFGVAADAYRSKPGDLASKGAVGLLPLVLAAGAFGIVLAAWLWWSGEADLPAFAVAVAVGALVFLSVHVAQEWERAAVMRLGRFNRLAGPGLFFTIPLIENVALYVDQRTIVTPFGAEEAMTADLVPLDVDAVLEWMVFNPKSACTEVEDYRFAVALAAQTALREAIGRANVQDVVMRRQQLDRKLQESIESRVSAWGATVLNVEIRNILIPESLHGVMSLEAQALQRKSARIVLAEVEKDVAAMYAEAAESYGDNSLALELRRMQLVYEGMQESDGTLVVPSAYGEGFVDKQDH